MPANKNSTHRASTNLDEAPDLATPEWSAKLSRANVVRGRPKLAQTKVSTTIRIDADVLQHFRAEGRGWQTKINRILRETMSGQSLEKPEAKMQKKQRLRG